MGNVFTEDFVFWDFGGFSKRFYSPPWPYNFGVAIPNSIFNIFDCSGQKFLFCNFVIFNKILCSFVEVIWGDWDQVVPSNGWEVANLGNEGS